MKLHLTDQDMIDIHEALDRSNKSLRRKVRQNKVGADNVEATLARADRYSNIAYRIREARRNKQ